MGPPPPELRVPEPDDFDDDPLPPFFNNKPRPAGVST
jgi:hypothetical protein